MERIQRAQALGDSERAKYMRGSRTFEINPKHPLVRELKARVSQLFVIAMLMASQLIMTRSGGWLLPLHVASQLQQAPHVATISAQALTCGFDLAPWSDDRT